MQLLAFQKTRLFFIPWMYSVTITCMIHLSQMLNYISDSPCWYYGDIVQLIACYYMPLTQTLCKMSPTQHSTGSCAMADKLHDCIVWKQFLLHNTNQPLPHASIIFNCQKTCLFNRQYYSLYHSAMKSIFASMSIYSQGFLLPKIQCII